MRVCQGVRTTQQQKTLYSQGRGGSPGPVVTQADGVRVKSNHQAQNDGFGHAVDCCFVGPSPFAETHPWASYGANVEAQGLIWGGGHTHGWHGQDRPHAQLPSVLRA